MEMMEKTVNTQYVEEEIIIDVKYVEKNVDNMMIIDSGAPVSIVVEHGLTSTLRMQRWITTR